MAHFSQQHQVKIFTVGKFHPYHQNNGQNNAPNNVHYEIHHVEDVHVVHNIGPNFSKGVKNLMLKIMSQERNLLNSRD